MTTELQREKCGVFGPYKKCEAGQGILVKDVKICETKFDESMAKCKKFCEKVVRWTDADYPWATGSKCLKWVDRNVTKEK